MNVFLFFVPIVLYLAGWLGESYRYWLGRGEGLPWPSGLLLVGWGAHAVLLAWIAVEGGGGSATVFNSPVLTATILTAFAFLSILIYYGLMVKMSSDVFPLVIPPLAIALLITAFFSFGGRLASADGGAGEWAFASYLLPAHIIAVLSGFILFGLACLASIFYLYQERLIKEKAAAVAESRLPPLGRLENYNHRAIVLGFFLLTIGLLLGLMVAGVETLSARLFSFRQLIPTLTWLVYAAFLIIHDLEGRRGRFGAILSIIGFAVVAASLVFEVQILIRGG